MKPALVLGLALAASAMVTDQAENELFIAHNGKFDRDVAQRFPGRIMYDEFADDELRSLPRDEFGNIVRPPYARFDEEADDELFMRPWIPQIYADDELAVKYVHWYLL